MSTSHFHRRGSALLALALAASLSTSAHADDDPRKTQADETFQEALRLHDKKRYAEAFEKFKEAYSIFPSPSTLLNIARVEGQLKDYVSATRHLREALRQPLLPPQNVELGKKLLLQLEPYVARVDVRGPRGMTISIAGEQIVLPLVEPLDLPAGVITAKGTLGSEMYEGHVNATEGKSVVLEMTKVASANAPSHIETPTKTPDLMADSGSKSGFWTTEHTVGLITGIGALAAAGVGVGLHLAANAKSDDIDAASKDPTAAKGCVGVASPACTTIMDGAHAERDLTNARDGFLIAGGALAVVSIAAFVWPRPSTPSSSGLSVSPILGASTGGAVLRGSF